ncbi:hypothetical protein [Halorussus amylolyticus]|uniref:hypothetical protein n=1 Tax=Halorussus amylolyticus TaxID=1126242 RepID=UPI001050D178|nr:hypothetical protein [Halorussus amylolyticus]
MSTNTPDHAHDPTAQTEPGENALPSERRDDELVVVVCPQRIYEQLRPELDEWREQLCRRYERDYEGLLAECAQLEDEVACLERQVERKEAQLDAVVARNEQILTARTESYRKHIDGENDDFEWTGRRQESGLLARLKRWLR